MPARGVLLSIVLTALGAGTTAADVGGFLTSDTASPSVAFAIRP